MNHCPTHDRSHSVEGCLRGHANTELFTQVCKLVAHEDIIVYLVGARLIPATQFEVQLMENSMDLSMGVIGICCSIVKLHSWLNFEMGRTI